MEALLIKAIIIDLLTLGMVAVVVLIAGIAFWLYRNKT